MRFLDVIALCWLGCVGAADEKGVNVEMNNEDTCNVENRRIMVISRFYNYRNKGDKKL